MTRRRWLRCIVLTPVLVAAACGPGSPRSANSEVQHTTPPSTPGTSNPAAPHGSGPTNPLPQPPPEPPPEPSTKPTTEGTGPETPQTPKNQPAVTLAAPLRSLFANLVFSASHPTRCVGYPLAVLDEDAAVAEVTLSPEGAFVRDDAACAGGPQCVGFVFRAGQPGICNVGVRWIPETRVTGGEATVRLTVLCRSQLDRLCMRLPSPPPPEGTNVVAVAIRSLKAVLPDRVTPPNPVSPTLDPPVKDGG
jgi:hypothetical protein